MQNTMMTSQSLTHGQTMPIDTCIACGYPVRLHFRDGRMVGCTEVTIIVTERIPAYPSGWAGCTQATRAGTRQVKKGKKHALRGA
jgi:hypothetical protein